MNPEDLARFFVERANAGDVEGLLALYEADAILATGAAGQVAIGHEDIRAFYSGRLADRPKFEPGEQRPALRQGDLALTSTRRFRCSSGGGVCSDVPEVRAAPARDRAVRPAAG